MAALTLTWYVCDIVTGQILSELPLHGVDTLTVGIAREDTQTFELDPLDESCPDDWADMVVKGKTMIVLTIDGEPAQAWIVDERTFGDVTVPIVATTLEECLHRTNVPDLPDPDDPLADGVYDDIEGCVALCASLGPRFGFVIEHTAAGYTSEFAYSNTEDRNLLDVLNERKAGEHPFEWRTLIRWADENTKQAFEKVLEIRPTIGIDRPDAIFDLDAGGRGCVESYRRNESFAQGKGATMMIGTSEGSGLARPMTAPIYSTLTGHGWPVWEERANFTGLPDTATTDEEDAELASRTRARLAQREQGTTSWTVVVNDTGPRPGVGYVEGDTAHIAIAPQGKQDPVGGTAAVRVLGWSYDFASGQTTPILQDGADT